MISKLLAAALLVATITAPSSVPAATDPPATDATPRAAWTPMPLPTQPPQTQEQMQYPVKYMQAQVSNLLGLIFAPYCTDRHDVLSQYRFNQSSDSPYPVVVDCIHTRLRVDGPGRATLIP